MSETASIFDRRNFILIVFRSIEAIESFQLQSLSTANFEPGWKSRQNKKVYFSFPGIPTETKIILLNV